MASLHPFGLASAEFHLDFSSEITRGSQALQARFKLSGPLPALTIPSAKQNPERRKGLWEETCFELFISEPGLKSYFEINLSPSGDWDVFHFQSYREGMIREPRVQSLAVDSAFSENQGILKCDIPLEALSFTGKELQLGATAVLLLRDGSYQYWALQHAGAQPDFHRKESFVHAIRF
jgi:hypothetical protein